MNKYLDFDIQLFADGKVVIETDLDEKGFESGLGKMQSIAKVGFGAIAGAVGAVSVAIAGVVTAGVKSFAELEQNIGGIETLFKDSADEVIKNAERAYKTAGMSANQYMSTVTSFSARLLQGLGDDTEEAARIADVAITDMADNANKMGTSIEMIQNAYQGFAKQNYTMLDNLKLGYGGTQSEMARLINDSGVLGDTIEVTAETVNEVSFDKMIEAIHVVQQEMGITGTTSKEAAETITGSLASASAAWDNFINGSGDIEEFVDAGLIAIENISKAIVKIAPNIADGLVRILDVAIKEMPQIFKDILPVLTDGVLLLFETITTTLVEMLPDVLDMGIKIILELIRGISETLPQLIPKIVEMIVLMTNTLIENIGLIVDAGIILIMALAEGLIEALPYLLDQLPLLIENLLTAILENLPKLSMVGLQLMLALVEGLIKSIPSIIAFVPKMFLALINSIGAYLGSMLDMGKKIVSKIKQGFSNIKNVGRDLILGLWEGIQNQWNYLKGKVENLGQGIVKKFKSVFGIKSPSRVMRDVVGKQLPAGIAVGIEANTDSALKSVENMKNEIMKKMQSAVDMTTNGINSKVSLNANYGSNSSIVLNNYLTTSVELDKQKVGQAITPVVTKTIKAGGI